MKAIVNVNANWGIGFQNDLLCKIPEDLEYFKDVTKNKAIVYGRKTLESFPGMKPLVGRTNIVISSDKTNIPEISKKSCEYYAYVNKKKFHDKDIGITGINFNNYEKDTPKNRIKTSLILITDISLAENVGMIFGHPSDDIFVIGGSMVYSQLLKYCDTVIVTKNNYEGPCDTYFPNLDSLDEWSIETRSGVKTSINGLKYELLGYVKK